MGNHTTPRKKDTKLDKIQARNKQRVNPTNQLESPKSMQAKIQTKVKTMMAPSESLVDMLKFDF